MDKKDIEAEIKRLQEELETIDRRTADGEAIEAGRTYYKVSPEGIE